MKPKSSSSIADSEVIPYEEDAPSVRSASPPSVCADSLYSSQSTVDTVAMTKITALEDELSRLREQIAKIVNVATNKPGTSGKDLLHFHYTFKMLSLKHWCNRLRKLTCNPHSTTSTFHAFGTAASTSSAVVNALWTTTYPNVYGYSSSSPSSSSSIYL